jgi:hypothetical protein
MIKMEIYDTLIIGSGYTSAGYSASHPKTIICEEREALDTSFYLPLSGFRYYPYAPKSNEGKRLFEVFCSLSLFDGYVQNTNGFESAFCTYLTERELPVLLKCRVVSKKMLDGGIIDATVQTNEGLTHLFTKKIIDARCKVGDKTLTVLFVADDIEGARREILREFEGATVEPAFYDGRCALRIPIFDMDENTVKPFIYKKWQTLTSGAKILFIAPAFSLLGDGNPMADESYNNPIVAFEAGFFFEGGDEL